MEFSDFLNIFLFNTSWNAGTLIRALKQTGYFQSLAEPNLIAYNNKEASFLAGGEFPIPIVNGVGQVSIEFKEFGVRGGIVGAHVVDRFGEPIAQKMSPHAIDYRGRQVVRGAN